MTRIADRRPAGNGDAHRVGATRAERGIANALATLMAHAPTRPASFPAAPQRAAGSAPNLADALNAEQLQLLRSVKARDNSYGWQTLWDEVVAHAWGWETDGGYDLDDDVADVLVAGLPQEHMEAAPHILVAVAGHATRFDSYRERRSEASLEHAVETDASWRRTWALRMYREAESAARGIAAVDERERQARMLDREIEQRR